MPTIWPDCWSPPGFDTAAPNGRRNRSRRRLPGECCVTQIELLRFVLRVLERLQTRYAIVGSYATGVWGDARMTRDIDIAVQVGPAQIKALCDAFPAGEFYVSLPAAEQAVRDEGQFNVIHFPSGNK